MSPLLQLVITLLVFFITIFTHQQVQAHIDGAGACFDSSPQLDLFLTSHGSSVCSPTDSNFLLYTSSLQMSNTMIAGCKYTISLCGPKPFKGFIVYAQHLASRLGSWNSPSSTPTRLISCSNNPSGTITHMNSMPKMHADFVFQTPNYVNGTQRMVPITMQARIVVSLNEWYTTSLSLSYLNIENDNGILCPESSLLPLTVCPSQGIIDSSGCPSRNASTSTGVVGNISDAGSMGTTSHDSMSMSHSMSTIFSTNWSGIELVFPGFTLSTTSMFIGAMIVCFLIAFALEALQYGQLRYEQFLIAQQVKIRSSAPTVKQVEFSNSHVFSPIQQMSRSLLHMLRLFLSIFLMITWMTLNVGLVVSALSGSVLGFFIFTRVRATSGDNSNTTSTASKDDGLVQCCAE